MRKITKEAVNAFIGGGKYDLDNFEVWMVRCGVVLVSIQVIEFYYSLFRGLL